MGQFGQGVQLVHELGELGAAEEIAHKVGEDPRVDEFLRLRDLLLLTGRLVRHAVFYITVHSGQGDAALVGHQFADRTDAAVAKVVDVVHLDGLAVLTGFFFACRQVQKISQRFDDIVFIQSRALLLFLVHGKAQFAVQFIAADVGEIVGGGLEEQALQGSLGLFLAERFAGLEAVVDLAQCFFAAVAGNVVLGGESLPVLFVLILDHAKDGRTGRGVVNFDAGDAGLEEFLKDLVGEFRGFFEGNVADGQFLAEEKALKVLVVGLGDLAVADLVEKV